MTTVKAELPYYEAVQLYQPNKPIEVQLRLWLNAKGFKFEDDGKFTLILNKDPKPLGTLTLYEDFNRGWYVFIQEIEE